MKRLIPALATIILAAPAFAQTASDDLNGQMLDAMKNKLTPAQTITPADTPEAYQIEQDITEIIEEPAIKSAEAGKTIIKVEKELTDDRIELEVPGDAKAVANETGEIVVNESAEDDVTVTLTEDADGHMIIEKRVTRTMPGRHPADDPDRAGKGVSMKVSLMSQNEAADSLNLSIIGDRITETRREDGARQFTIRSAGENGKSITVTIEEKNIR